MCIVEASLERSLAKFRKICRKALTLSYKRKLPDTVIMKFLQKYALLTLSLDVICDVIY